jgi:hypothetical protein
VLSSSHEQNHRLERHRLGNPVTDRLPRASSKDHEFKTARAPQETRFIAKKDRQGFSRLLKGVQHLPRLSNNLTRRFLFDDVPVADTRGGNS